MLPNTLRATSALARRRARALLTTTALLSLTVAACDADSPTRPDPTPGRSERIIAANGTTLHVVDYGGTGPAVVFLAGLGNSADVFDDFAPRFTGAHHVYAFTRRGFGASGRPTGGYETAALGDDVRALLDSLHIARAVLVGHSVAGDELTVLDLYVAVVSRFGPWRERFYEAAPRMATVIRHVDTEPRLAALWRARFPET